MDPNPSCYHHLPLKPTISHPSSKYGFPQGIVKEKNRVNQEKFPWEKFHKLWKKKRFWVAGESRELPGRPGNVPGCFPPGRVGEGAVVKGWRGRMRASGQRVRESSLI
jgi:hypothetical protein